MYTRLDNNPRQSSDTRGFKPFKKQLVVAGCPLEGRWQARGKENFFNHNPQ